MPDKKDIKNFLNKNIHDNTLDSILLISAPVNDDADYDMLTEGAVHNALQPFVKFFKEAGMDHIIEFNWGDSWLNDSPHWSTHINVVVKPTIAHKHWPEESMMHFRLKFNDLVPITDLSPYMTDYLKS